MKKYSVKASLKGVRKDEIDKFKDALFMLFGDRPGVKEMVGMWSAPIATLERADRDRKHPDVVVLCDEIDTANAVFDMMDKWFGDNAEVIAIYSNGEE